MEEIKHVTFEEANNDFEANFACADCRINTGDPKKGKSNSEKVSAVISIVIVLTAIGIFLIFKFL